MTVLLHLHTTQPSISSSDHHVSPRILLLLPDLFLFSSPSQLTTSLPLWLAVCVHTCIQGTQPSLQPYVRTTWITCIFHHPSVIFHHRSIGLALCEVLWALDFHTSVDQVYTAGSEVPTVVGRPAVALIHHLICHPRPDP